jgi:tRNA G46 methylase TrmB
LAAVLAFHFWIHSIDGIVHVSPHPSFRFDFHQICREFNPIYFHRYWPKPGEVCVDVGAGLGFETISMAQAVGATGKVISVEASPPTFEFLSRSIKANGFLNCVPVHVAISDKNSTVKIESITIIAFAQAIAQLRIGLGRKWLRASRWINS